jgi:hypothetical protein
VIKQFTQYCIPDPGRVQLRSSWAEGGQERGGGAAGLSWLLNTHVFSGYFTHDHIVLAHSMYLQVGELGPVEAQKTCALRVL